MFQSSGCWVGIDVSKAFLDGVFGTNGNPFRIPNTPAGFKMLLKQLQGTAVAGIVAESTGFYHRGMATYLWEQGFPPSIVNPVFIKNYRKSGLKRAKTDQQDARLLAQYGEERTPPILFPKHGALQLLSDLVSARHDHVVAKGGWRNRSLNPYLPTVVQERAHHCIQMHGEAIACLDREMATVIAEDPILRSRDAILQSVPGIALVRSATLLAYLPELGMLSNPVIASLVGLAPHAQDSGERSGHRYIQGGRAAVKDALVLLACSPRVLHPVVRARRQRYLESGKKRLVTAVAVARWLITILNTMITKDLMWEELDIVKAT